MTSTSRNSLSSRLRARPFQAVGTVLVAGLVSACASSSPQYYSLAEPSAPPVAASTPRGQPTGTQPAAASAAGVQPGALYVELAPVAMPERYARPQLVLRKKGAPGGSAEVDLLEQHRWASSFEDELRDALSSGVAARLGAVDASRSPRPRGQPAIRIGVQMRKFEAAQSAAVDADFSWTLRRLDDERAVACRLMLSEPVGDGVEAVAAGAQRLTSRLADAIAASAREVQAGRAASGCAGSAG